MALVILDAQDAVLVVVIVIHHVEMDAPDVLDHAADVLDALRLAVDAALDVLEHAIVAVAVVVAAVVLDVMDVQDVLLTVVVLVVVLHVLAVVVVVQDNVV